MITQGRSEPAMYEIPSDLSEIPGEDDDVIERLGTVPVKSDYLKDLVRNDIRKEQQNIQGDHK